MPTLCGLSTKNVHFSHPLVAPPRLLHGLRELDIDKRTAIRVQSTNQYISNAWADCHITTWLGTTLYSAASDVFVLPPADMQYLTGQHGRGTDDDASVRIDFERPFITPPKVVVFFNFIDLDPNYNWRLSTSATDIDVNGFTLTIGTWGNTIIYGAKACWVAYPEDEKHIFSMSANTNDVRSWKQPQLQQSKSITFENVEFWKNPTVFVALNSFDIDCRANFRIKAYVDNVSRTGLVWHIDTWADTILYSAGASIIAFNE